MFALHEQGGRTTSQSARQRGEALIAMLLLKSEVDRHPIKRLRARKTRLGRTVAV